MQKIFSIEQVAEMLSLHPKTVGAYIRKGRIQAVKTGKQWRISEEALVSFMQLQQSESVPAQESYSPEQSLTKSAAVTVSTVIDIAVKNEQEAYRLSTTVFAVLQSESANGYREKGAERIAPRCDYTYYPESGKARFILWGDIEFIMGMLQSVRNFI